MKKNSVRLSSLIGGSENRTRYIFFSVFAIFFFVFVSDVSGADPFKKTGGAPDPSGSFFIRSIFFYILSFSLLSFRARVVLSFIVENILYKCVFSEKTQYKALFSSLKTGNLSQFANCNTMSLSDDFRQKDIKSVERESAF